MKNQSNHFAIEILVIRAEIQEIPYQRDEFKSTIFKRLENNLLYLNIITLTKSFSMKKNPRKLHQCERLQ